MVCRCGCSSFVRCSLASISSAGLYCSIRGEGAAHTPDPQRVARLTVVELAVTPSSPVGTDPQISQQSPNSGLVRVFRPAMRSLRAGPGQRPELER